MVVQIERSELLYEELLTAVTGTGAGVELGLRRPAPKDFTVQILTTGLVSGTFALEGSVDGTTWVALATHVFTSAEVTANKAMIHVLDSPVNFIRGNLTAFSGTTLTARALIRR